MDDLTLADFLRSFLVVTSISVVVFLTYRFVRAYKSLSRGQKFFIGGPILLLIAMAARSTYAILHNDPLVWPLIFYVFGLLCFIVYLAEPYYLARKRHGRDIFDPKGPGEL
jgi:O-antigen/teichoic acid export membrane protein